jgi:precorrin-6A/cobalt-precorrin-6A reductase
MILVFGGTTEGKQVSSVLAGAGYPYWYSTKTEVAIDLPLNGRYRHGALTPEALTGFCRQEGIRLIINAAHPFASLLHEMIDQVALLTGIPVIRPEREYPVRLLHPLVSYMADYTAVLRRLEEGDYAPVLALTGVQTITRLQPYWQQNKMLFRILPRDNSLALARAAGFPEEDLLLSFPPAAVEEELALIRRTGARAVLTKESGESGGLSVKIAAAIAAGVPLFIISRPTLPAGFIAVDGPAVLLREIKNQLS